MNKLEHRLRTTLQAITYLQQDPRMPSDKKDYVLRVLERHYDRLNDRYVKQFRVDFNPSRTLNGVFYDD